MGLTILDTSVEVLLILTNDHHIHRRVLGFNEWIVGDAGTDIRVQAKSCACRNVSTLVTPALGCSDRRLQKNPRAAERFPCAWLDARADPAQIHFLANFHLFY